MDREGATPPPQRNTGNGWDEPEKGWGYGAAKKTPATSPAPKQTPTPTTNTPAKASGTSIASKLKPDTSKKAAWEEPKTTGSKQKSGWDDDEFSTW
jgi:hypothetical protein